MATKKISELPPYPGSAPDAALLEIASGGTSYSTPMSDTRIIADDSVTYAKIQNVTTDKLLGRVSTGTGDVEEVTCTDFAQSLLDDPDATTAVATLGLDSIIARVAQTANTEYYVRSTPATVTISIGSPAVVSWASHGLSVDDVVIFSKPEDMFGNVSISNASPAVVTFAGHGLTTDDAFHFETSYGTGALGLPAGVTANTTYYVISTGLTSSTFQFSTSVGGAAVNSSSAGSSDARHYCFRDATLPTGITAGVYYYVIAAGFGSNSFQISTSAGGSAVNTTGTTAGKITATTGNDSNDGLSPTRTGAWLTLQHAYDYIALNVDTAGFDANVNLAGSVYTPITGGNAVQLAVPWVGGGRMRFRGDNTYPTNAVLAPGSRSGFYVSTSLAGPLFVESMYITTGGFHDGIGAEAPCKIFVRNLVHGQGDWQMALRSTGAIIQDVDFTTTEADPHLGTRPNSSEKYRQMIRAGASPGGHIQAANGANYLNWRATIILNNPAINIIAFAFNNGVINMDGGGRYHGQFSGSVYIAAGGTVRSSISFSGPDMTVNRPAPTTQNRARYAGGQYDDLGFPHFFAHKNGTNQDFTSSAVTKVTFPTLDFDESNRYDEANSQLILEYHYTDYYNNTSVEAPMWYIDCGLHITSLGVGTTNIKLHLYRGGALYRTIAQQNIPTGLTDITLRGSSMFRFDQYISFVEAPVDLRIEFTGLSSGTATIDGASTATWWTGFKSL